MRTAMKCLGAVLIVVWLGCVAIWLIEGENALGFFGVAYVLFVAFVTLAYKILKSLTKSETDSPQNQKLRHLIAMLGFAALAAVCFGLLTWALVEGAVIETFTDSNIGKGAKSFGTYYYEEVRTREDYPGYYWSIVGLIAFFGTLFTALAAWEYRSYRFYRGHREGETSSEDLLAKIDQACTLYPEAREVLLRIKTVLPGLNHPEAETGLGSHLERVLNTADREAALKEINGLAKVLGRMGKL